MAGYSTRKSSVRALQTAMQNQHQVSESLNLRYADYEDRHLPHAKIIKQLILGSLTLEQGLKILYDMV